MTNFVPRLCSVGIMVSESVCVSCATKIKRVWSDLQETGRGVRLESIAAGVLARVGSDGVGNDEFDGGGVDGTRSRMLFGRYASE